MVSKSCFAKSQSRNVFYGMVLLLWRRCKKRFTQSILLAVSYTHLFDEANSQWKVDAGNYLFKIGSDVENIKGTATLKVAESVSYTHLGTHSRNAPY